MRCSPLVVRCSFVAKAESSAPLPEWKIRIRRKALRRRSVAKKKRAGQFKEAVVEPPAELASDALRWRGEPWKQHRRELRRLQCSIYRASQASDNEAVEKLQATLLESIAAKSLAVRRVAMTHPQRRLPGADGVHSLNEDAQKSLRDALTIDGLSDVFDFTDVPRAWSDLRREDSASVDALERLCVCTMMDRAKQVLLSWALEPTFEGVFNEWRIMSHRPGRSVHDVFDWIRRRLKGQPLHALVVRLEVENSDKMDSVWRHWRMSRVVACQLGSWVEAGLLDLGLSCVGIGRHGEEHGCPILPFVSNLLCAHLVQTSLEKTEDDNLQVIGWNGRLLAVGQRSALTRLKDRLEVSAEAIGLGQEIVLQSAVDDWIQLFDFQFKQHRPPSSESLVAAIEPRDGVLERHLQNLKTAFRLSRIFHEDKSGLINRCNPIIRSFSDRFATADAVDQLETADAYLKTLLIDWSVREHGALNPEEAVGKAFSGKHEADLGFEFITRIVRLLRHGDAVRKFRPPPIDDHRSPYDEDRSHWKDRLQHWEYNLYPSLL